MHERRTLRALQRIVQGTCALELKLESVAPVGLRRAPSTRADAPNATVPPVQPPEPINSERRSWCEWYGLIDLEFEATIPSSNEPPEEVSMTRGMSRGSYEGNMVP